jgi:hypothetical protein
VVRLVRSGSARARAGVDGGAVTAAEAIEATEQLIEAGTGSRPLQDALVFNDKWLPGVLGPLGAAIKCDVSGCRLAKPSPWERSLPRYS